MDRPEDVTRFQEWDYDNFKFIIQELFLYLISVLARNERFAFLGYMLRQQYYVERTPHGERGKMLPFSIFRNHLRILEHRKQRLSSNRLSIHADLLEQHSKASGLAFEHLMQGDLILFVRASLDVSRNGGRQGWWPETLLYAERHNGPFEIFARAQSRTYFDSMKLIFDIASVDDLKSLMESFKEEKLYTPHWEFTRPDIGSLMNIENLGERP